MKLLLALPLLPFVTAFSLFRGYIPDTEEHASHRQLMGNMAGGGGGGGGVMGGGVMGGGVMGGGVIGGGGGGGGGMVMLVS